MDIINNKAIFDTADETLLGLTSPADPQLVLNRAFEVSGTTTQQHTELAALLRAAKQDLSVSDEALEAIRGDYVQTVQANRRAHRIWHIIEEHGVMLSFVEFE